MPLKLPTFEVYLAADGVDAGKAVDTGDYTVHRVTVVHADQLVAEQAGPRYGLTELKANPLGYTTLWCWAALRRGGTEVPEFPLFKARVIAIEKPEGDADEVDPTTPPAVTDWP